MIPILALIIGFYIFINFMVAMIIILHDYQNSIDEGKGYYTSLFLFGLPLLIVSFLKREDENV